MGRKVSRRTLDDDAAGRAWPANAGRVAGRVLVLALVLVLRVTALTTMLCLNNAGTLIIVRQYGVDEMGMRRRGEVYCRMMIPSNVVVRGSRLC